jgi:hypothetical protein
MKKAKKVKKIKRAKPITKALAIRVLNVVDAGLVDGVGDPEPGKMCVEAAVSYAMGEPHTDRPTCVHPRLRQFKIWLNDGPWDSDLARTKGLREIAIAQLGSVNTLNWELFQRDLSDLVLNKFSGAALKEQQKLLKEVAEKLVACKTTSDFSEIYEQLPAEDEFVGLDTANFDFEEALIEFIDCNSNLSLEGALKAVTKLAVQCLIKQKIPGTRYLDLLKRKPTKKIGHGLDKDRW